MLKKNPDERITAENALKHTWFNQDEQNINNEVIEFA